MARKANHATDLRKFGGLRVAGATTMVPLADLEVAAVTLSAEEGPERHEIAVRRFKSGQIAMTCDCRETDAQGWCRHRLNALCGRFGELRDMSEETATAFRRIVGGTLMEEDAIKLDVLLKDFDSSLRAFDAGRPAGIRGDDLSIFTELVSDLAAAAAELEDAVGRMRRRFDVGNSLLQRRQPSEAVTS